MADTTTSATDTDRSALSSGFDVRLVGQKSVLEIKVHRNGDLLEGNIVCELTIASVSCRDGKSVIATDTIFGHDYEEVTREAVAFVTTMGQKIRNLTRFRYDMESAVRAVDLAIHRMSDEKKRDPRDETVSVSVCQVEEMLDDLPMDIRSYVDKMLVDAFKEALRNVIAAAYDAGYRAGQSESRETSGDESTEEMRDLFDYEGALQDADFETIRW